jgi:predicted ester cyclase
MNSETVKENEKRFFNYVNQRDTVSMEKWVDEFVAEDFVNHSPVLDVPADREGLKQMFHLLFQLFPQMIISIEEMVFENDTLCFRHTLKGISGNGPVMGIAMVRYKNGRITDRWVTTEGG